MKKSFNEKIIHNSEKKYYHEKIEIKTEKEMLEEFYRK